MTREHEERLHSFVENLLFKGAARASMLIATVVGGPILVIILVNTYGVIQELRSSVAELRSHNQLIELSMANDRAAALKLSDDAQRRLDLAFARINMAPTKNETDKDFQLRDQRIDVLDKRVGGLESRLNGPAAH